MKVDESLAGLKTAFDEWRRRKRHPREAIPANLVESARLAVRRHGPAAVVRATKIDRERLKGGGRAAAAVPTFSRLEFGPLPAATHPFAEIVTTAGVKVRLFAQSNEALALISSLCGAGATR